MFYSKIKPFSPRRSVGLVVAALVLSACSEKRDDLPQPTSKAAPEIEIVAIDPNKQDAPPSAAQRAVAQDSLTLITSIDGASRSGKGLEDYATYIRTFDGPVHRQIERWEGVAGDTWPLGLCRDALRELQIVGSMVRDQTMTKFADEHRVKYGNLKRRCKAALAGDMTEVEKRD